jgi:hypothetical protein
MTLVRTLLLCCGLLVPLLLPLSAWTSPFPAQLFRDHDRTWWIAQTPRCWGPVCVNVWQTHVDFILRLRW